MTEHEQGALIGREDMAEMRDHDDLNAPVEWAGLPAFHPQPERKTQLVLSFDTDEQRDQLIAQLGIIVAKKTGRSWSAWWPPREREDLAALRFDFDAPEPAADPDPLGAWEDHVDHNVDEGDGDYWRCADCDVRLPPMDEITAAARSYGREMEEDGWSD